MINEIIKGVSMKLNATFGAGYKIYQNDVEQGFKEPCFFIAVLKPDISPLHYTTTRENWELRLLLSMFLH